MGWGLTPVIKEGRVVLLVVVEEEDAALSSLFLRLAEAPAVAAAEGGGVMVMEVMHILENDNLHRALDCLCKR